MTQRMNLWGRIRALFGATPEIPDSTRRAPDVKESAARRRSRSARENAVRHVPSNRTVGGFTPPPAPRCVDPVEARRQRALDDADDLRRRQRRHDLDGETGHGMGGLLVVGSTDEYGDTVPDRDASEPYNPPSSPAYEPPPASAYTPPSWEPSAPASTSWSGSSTSDSGSSWGGGHPSSSSSSYDSGSGSGSSSSSGDSGGGGGGGGSD